MQLIVYFLFVFFCLSAVVWGLAKVAIFTTNVDAENQTLINHKCVCGALNRHFCQTRFSGGYCFLSGIKSNSLGYLLNDFTLYFACL